MMTNDTSNPSTYKEYMERHIADCKRTGIINDMIERNFENPYGNTFLLTNLVGMQTELGELADIIQKKVFYGIDFDVPALIEEMGDFLFYWDLLLDHLRKETCCDAINDITIRNLNRKKRKLRYPNGYSNKACNERDLEKEREIFENIDTTDSSF